MYKLIEYCALDAKANNIFSSEEAAKQYDLFDKLETIGYDVDQDEVMDILKNEMTRIMYTGTNNA